MKWAVGRRKGKWEETKGVGQERQTNLTLQRNLPLHIKQLLLLLLSSLLSGKERKRTLGYLQVEGTERAALLGKL